MKGTQSEPARGNAAVHAALAKETSSGRKDPSPASRLDSARKISGYGLPCSKCHLYYSADLEVCPTCKHNERLSPVLDKVPLRRAQAAAESNPAPTPDASVVDQEREEFLRQFKSQAVGGAGRSGLGTGISL